MEIGEGAIRAVILAFMVAFMAITSWILGLRMKKRIKRTLGSGPSNESELVSLNTWMRVADAEEKRKNGIIQ